MLRAITPPAVGLLFAGRVEAAPHREVPPPAPSPRVVCSLAAPR